MKNYLTTLLIVLVQIISFGGNNVALKPNFGIGLTEFSKDCEGIKSEATLGTEIGIDLLIGRQVYFQTGIRYIKDSYKLTGSLENIEDIQSTVHNEGLKIPLHLGIYLVDFEKSVEVVSNGSVNFV